MMTQRKYGMETDSNLNERKKNRASKGKSED